MFEFLQKVDTIFFLWLNSMHSPFFDNVMYWISGRFIWIPLYVAILFYFVYRFRAKSAGMILTLILLIVFTDQMSVLAFKEIFHRLRPCHHSELAAQVHLVNGHCGGKYGFISSHAANSFALSMMVYFFLKKKWVLSGLLLWAALVSYSRVYLGVHYPGDVIVGALFGLLSAMLFYYVYQKVYRAC